MRNSAPYALIFYFYHMRLFVNTCVRAQDCVLCRYQKHLNKQNYY